MVPTLDKEELRDRMVQAAKPTTMDNVLRKRNNSGEGSVERKIKMKIGKYMKKAQPKSGLENIDA